LNKLTRQLTPGCLGWASWSIADAPPPSSTGPVNIFPHPGGRYVVVLTKGPKADSVKNVIATRGYELLTRGTHIELTAP
jgi:hypothetical protein